MASRTKSQSKTAVEKSAGAVVFFRGKTIEYLLIRSKHWEFPKGWVEQGESEHDAALREVREETGLGISLVPNFRETIDYFYRRKDGTLVKKQVVYFLGETAARTHKISWADYSRYFTTN
jgi:8-oxo-dGTP pyrophosphatase MutT (NUDIX family)